MRRSRSTKAGILLAVAVLGGCSTTNGPFGRERLALPVGPSYVGGRGMQMYPTSTTLLGNVKDSMSDVGVHSIVQNSDPSGLIILDGKAADDRKIRVTIQNTGTRANVSARVGWVGDEPLTRALLDRIGSRQGVLAPTPSANDAAPEEPEKKSGLSRDAVPDETMLRDQLDPGYNQRIVP